MKRKIKFRAWDLGAKMMYLPSDIYGDIRDEMGLSLNGDTMFFYESGNGNHCPPSLSTRMATVELMQFTGLLDKNGNEIYEGDRLRLIDTEVTVFYNEATASFDILYDGGDNDSLYSNIEADIPMEVIGNIYENPELVNQK